VGECQFCHRVIPVANQDPFIESLGPCFVDAGIRLRSTDSKVRLVQKFIQQDTAQTLFGARVAAEQGAGHYLRKSFQCKDPVVEVGQVTEEKRTLSGCEVGRRLAHAGQCRGAGRGQGERGRGRVPVEPMWGTDASSSAGVFGHTSLHKRDGADGPRCRPLRRPPAAAVQ